jgi:hypothetical protein
MPIDVADSAIATSSGDRMMPLAPSGTSSRSARSNENRKLRAPLISAGPFSTLTSSSRPARKSRKATPMDDMTLTTGPA